MRNLLRQKFIKVLALLAITNAVFVGGVAHAQNLLYQPPFSPFVTVIASPNSLAVTENVESFDLECIVTTGACVIGFPPSGYPDSFMRGGNRTLSVTYQVVSVSTPTKCEIGVISNLRSIAGTVAVTATTSQITANFTHTLATAVSNFGFGIRSNDTSNPCTMTLRVSEIEDSIGNILWSPANNGASSGGVVVNVDVPTSSSSFPDSITVEQKNDQLWNFTLMTLLFFGTTMFIILIIRPLYVRK